MAVKAVNRPPVDRFRSNAREDVMDRWRDRAVNRCRWSADVAPSSRPVNHQNATQSCL